MGEFRNKMLQKMELKNFSPRTIEVYLYHMEKLVKYYRKSPDKISYEEIESHLHNLLIQKASSSAMAQAYSAVKYFYCEVMDRDWKLSKIPRPKTEKKLPVILSAEEVKRIIDLVRNRRSRIILMTLYSGGMRLKEATHLKIKDIDSKRMEIRIEQGKGKKDRYTILSKVLLKELRKYYRTYKPKDWLFPGRNNKPVSETTIQRAFGEAKKKPELQKRRQYTHYGIVLQPTC